MLLITRRENEAIVINGTITVKVLEVRGGRVKLGFEFPAGSTVFREELFAKIQAENLAAALPKAIGTEGAFPTENALPPVLKSLQQKIKNPDNKNDDHPKPPKEHDHE